MKNTYDELMEELRKKIPNPAWESVVAREAVRFLCKKIDEMIYTNPDEESENETPPGEEG